MKRYDRGLALSALFDLTPEPQDDLARAEFRTDLLHMMKPANNSVLEQVFERRIRRYVVALMRGGIVFAQFEANLFSRQKGRVWKRYYTYVDWKDVMSVTCDASFFSIETKIDHFSVYADFNKDLERLKERWAVLQNHGLIPSTATPIFREPEPKKKEKKEPPKGGAFSFPVVLLAIAVGYPMYIGGGSLYAAVAPDLADIAPDAAATAVKQHPEWPLTTRVTLVGVAKAYALSPQGVLADGLGLRQNSLKSLLLVPVFWIERFASRPTQVDLMASYFIGMVEADQKKGAKANPR